MKEFKFVIYQKVLVTKAHHYNVEAGSYDEAIAQMEQEFEDLTLSNLVGFTKTVLLDEGDFTMELEPDDFIDNMSTKQLCQFQDKKEDSVFILKFNGEEEFDEEEDEEVEANGSIKKAPEGGGL